MYIFCYFFVINIILVYCLQIEELYATLLYMIQHQIGFDVSRECSQETLFNHLQNAFKVDNETHERVLEETKNLEAIIFTIIFYREIVLYI